MNLFFFPLRSLKKKKKKNVWVCVGIFCFDLLEQFLLNRRGIRGDLIFVLLGILHRDYREQIFPDFHKSNANHSFPVSGKK